ncbi:MAG: VOC family protein [Acidimicrobiales bacterium]
MTTDAAQLWLVLDCQDPEALAAFWAPALDYLNTDRSS